MGSSITAKKGGPRQLSHSPHPISTTASKLCQLGAIFFLAKGSTQDQSFSNFFVLRPYFKAAAHLKTFSKFAEHYDQIFHFFSKFNCFLKKKEKRKKSSLKSNSDLSILVRNFRCTLRKKLQFVHFCLQIL